MTLSFTRQLAFILSCTVLIGIAAWWSYSAYQLENVLNNQIALRAQVQSQQLAKLPSLIDAVERENAQLVSEIISVVQLVSDADFITVSDEEGIRLAHPVSERVGLPVVGGDIQRALNFGEAYLSQSVGSLGPSVRYISPIFSPEGEVVGMVKVGYLVETLNLWSREKLLPLLLFALSALSLFLLLSWRFSSYLKKQMQDLEPWQLKQALKTHQGVLDATHEAVVAVNQQGNIYLANDAARAILGQSELVGKETKQLDDASHLFHLDGDDFLDKVAQLGSDGVIINRVTMRTSNGEAAGAVFTLRQRSELQALSDRISQVDKYLESMRVTHHEHQNKLSVISGLLQMGAFEKALSVCLAQAAQNQTRIDSLQGVKSMPQLTALLLAKLSKARESNQSLNISCYGDLSGLTQRVSEEQVCSLVGNLIDNGLEACQGQNDATMVVKLRETEEEFILTFSNNGPSLDEDLESLCRWGYSTKSATGEHGIGLHLVKSILSEAHGHVELDSDEQETLFTVYLPKE
ncbi:TPA: sensor histidine kinase [Vibrio vulnificus]|uniref:GHKL domain-containing protein n=1 Tax=Vibrio vulnificus TaxID=672 RepID=UPI00102972E2|nr:sensor histidine kinase [Vibrio vulnificus]RZR03311.1 sensor histidine kinase [Vibrio vulnificus]HDY7665454.1 sensor histidine kinase [Vibrio vulnificus]HDY7670647.1 sensor histidine kinase [Vibrio vulnificus]